MRKKKIFQTTLEESLIEQHQRNYILQGLNNAEDNDLIILSDTDEIPDLNKINQIKNNTKFTAFLKRCLCIS